jgi:hypothetical protein
VVVRPRYQTGLYPKKSTQIWTFMSAEENIQQESFSAYVIRFIEESYTSKKPKSILFISIRKAIHPGINPDVWTKYC